MPTSTPLYLGGRADVGIGPYGNVLNLSPPGRIPGGVCILYFLLQVIQVFRASTPF